MKILIVGTGAIAKGLAKLIHSRHGDWEILFFSSKDNRGHFNKVLKCSDLVCITISTKDDGQAATSYILEALRAGKPVVTCEKGALSEHFSKLRPYLNRIGYTATIGGGSGMLNLLKTPLRVSEIQGVVNGTLNFLGWAIDEGYTLAEAITGACQLQLVEPGAETITAIVNAELCDARRKAVILHNLAQYRSKSMIRYSDCSYMTYGDNGARKLFQDGKRFIVHMFPRADHRKHCVRYADPSFFIHTMTHDLVGAFVNVDGIFPHLPLGADNCLLVHDNGEPAFAYGKGAGVKETASAMLSDIKQLMEVN